MTVFKGYLKCMKGNLHTVIMYCGIFITVSMVMAIVSADKGNGGDYTSDSLSIAVEDQDHSLWSQTLTEYLSQYHQVEVTKRSRKELADALYYDEVQYLILLPENFKELCLTGREKLETVPKPGSTDQYYVDLFLDQFISSARAYLAAGYSDQEAAQAVLDTGKVQGKVTLNTRHSALDLYNVFRILPYLYLSILCFTMGMIQREYQKPDIKRRLLASCVPLRKKNLQILAAYLAVGTAVWAVGDLTAMVLCWDSFWSSPSKAYILVNSFAVMLGSLSTAFLLGSLAKTYAAVNGMANVASLAMCFLGGVFVPVEILTEGVKKVGQFFPTYWHSQNISLLSFHGSLSPAQKEEFLAGCLLQVLFAAACVAVALAVSRGKQQEE